MRDAQIRRGERGRAAGASGRVLSCRPADAVERAAAADLHQLHQRAGTLGHLGFEGLSERVEVDLGGDGGVDSPHGLREDSGIALGATWSDGPNRHGTPREKARGPQRVGVLVRAAGWAKGPAAADQHGGGPSASPERVRSRAVLALSLASHVWWAPSTLLAVVPALALDWSIGHRLRRAHRLAGAGRRDEALRVYAAVRHDIAADLWRARGRRGAP